ncbi:hypothetical protein M3Y96_00257900 [Aphelenchoides besseyi]|nr:hypothetical protein M3Y96_00257900 [Aphelenchoides besseyi]
MVYPPLLISVIVTTLFALIALVTTAVVVYRVLKFERARLNDAETNAFRLMDEMLRSMLPRNLGKRLAEMNKVHAVPGPTVEDVGLASKQIEEKSKDK